jgi:hypothetical protein
MTLPFSRDAFLDTFGAYNLALWGVAAGLWLATAMVAWLWWRDGARRQPLVLALLAVHWSWSGLVYHWLYFRAINPAASVFAAAFALQGLILARAAVTSRPSRTDLARWRQLTACAFISFGLAYPMIGVMTGLTWPRLPLFAVPCPTTLVTAGWLLGSQGVPRVITVIPLLWAGIGSTAAFSLGISADLALVAAAAMLAFNLVRPAA